MDEVVETNARTPHPSVFGCHLLPQEKAFFDMQKTKEKPRARRGYKKIAIYFASAISFAFARSFA